MRKLGGVLLIVLGAAMVLFGVLRALDVLSILLSGDPAAYGMGFMAGTIVAVIILVGVGWKAIDKGRELVSAQ